MKNTATIGFLLIIGTCVSLINTAQQAARLAWSYKFALVGTSLFLQSAHTFNEKLEDRLRIFDRLEGYKAQTTLPTNEQEIIIKRFNSYGLEVGFSDACNLGPEANMAVGRIGTRAHFNFNKPVVTAFDNKNLTTSDVNYAEMWALFEHEFGHVQDRFQEILFCAQAFFNTCAFTAGVGTYKIATTCGKRMSGPKKLLLHAVGAAAGVYVDYEIKNKRKVILASLSRHYERKADDYILNSEDPEMIKAFKSLLQKKSDYSSDTPPWWENTRTHPSNKERIQACDEALIKLEATKT